MRYSRPHVMGRLGLMAKRRPAQNEFLLRVFQQVGEVRCPAWELADLWLTTQARNMGLEVAVDDRGVELFAVADTGGLIIKRHAYPFYL